MTKFVDELLTLLLEIVYAFFCVYDSERMQPLVKHNKHQSTNIGQIALEQQAWQYRYCKYVSSQVTISSVLAKDCTVESEQLRSLKNEQDKRKKVTSEIKQFSRTKAKHFSDNSRAIKHSETFESN